MYVYIWMYMYVYVCIYIYIGFKNNKSLRDHLVRSQLRDIEETGMSKPCGERDLLVICVRI